MQQDGIDVEIHLSNAAKDRLATIDGPGGPWGPELLGRVAHLDETLRIDIVPFPGQKAAGRYRLQSSISRPATSEDHQRARAIEIHRRADASQEDEAIALYRRASQTWQAAGEPRMAARALRRLGQRLMARDLHAAREAVLQAVAWLEPLDHDWEWVGLHNDLGSLHRSLLDMQAAESAYSEARRVAERRGDGAGLASAFNNLGLVAQARGDLETALQHYSEAERRFEARNQLEATATAKANRGLALVALGELARADDVLRQALAAYRQDGHVRGEATALSSLGWIAHLQHAHADAVQLYAASLRLRAEFPDAHDVHGESITLMLRGASQEQLGRPSDARQDLEKALALQSELGDRLGEAFARTYLARLQLADNHSQSPEDRLPRDAAHQLQRAAELFETLDDPQGLAQLEVLQARWHRHHGRLHRALEHMERAQARLESLRAQLLSPKFRRSQLSMEPLDSGEHVDLLLELHRAEPTRGWSRRAFEAAEGARGQTLRDELKLGTAWRQAADPDLLQQQRQGLETLRTLETRRVTLARARPDAPKLPHLQVQIRHALEEHARLEGAIRRSAGLDVEALVPAGTLDLLQESLDAQTSFLAYHLTPTPDTSVVWVIRRDAFSMHPIRLTIAEAGRATQTLLDLMEQGSNALAQAQIEATLDDLSRRLLPGSVRRALTGSELLMVPDGPLGLLPLAMLPWDDAPLGQRFDAAQLPSAAVWHQLRRRQAQRRLSDAPPPQSLAMIADPRYRPASAETEEVASSSPPSRDAVRSSFDPLPGSRREAEAILELVAGPTLSLLGPRASRRAVLEAHLGNYRLVHFATHGLLEMGRPEMSAIVLSLIDDAGGPMDGFLRLTDLERLQLRADLVVLSACRSGRGEQLRGEGVFGLAHAVFRAGGQALVVSHWQVDDQATAVLMPRFYQELLAGHSPAGALRLAQQYLRQHTPWKDPVYWAAFSVQGDALQPLFDSSP